MTKVHLAGFPHSDTHGSLVACTSPWLFAAFCVLLRLLVPRHSPIALIRLTVYISFVVKYIAFLGWIDVEFHISPLRHINFWGTNPNLMFNLSLTVFAFLYYLQHFLQLCLKCFASVFITLRIMRLVCFLQKIYIPCVMRLSFFVFSFQGAGYCIFCFLVFLIW